MAHDAQPEDVSISQRVIGAVADERGVDPLELPPLYDAIDPDGLEKLFPYELDGSGTAGRVAFTLAGCEVVVHSTGEVVVTPIDGGVPGSPAMSRADERDGAETLE